MNPGVGKDKGADLGPCHDGPGSNKRGEEAVSWPSGKRVAEQHPINLNEE